MRWCGLLVRVVRFLKPLRVELAREAFRRAFE